MSTSASIGSQVRDPQLPLEFFEPHWYAAYTNANHEKSVAAQLTERSVEHFLPLCDSIRRWKDRRMNLQLPVFPGYVFVHLPLCDRLKVLQTPGVVRLVGFNGQPCALRESEVQAMQVCLDKKSHLEPHQYVQTGRRVRIKAGPLEGLQGIVIRKKNRLKFILSIELINCSAAVEVDGADVEPVRSEAQSNLRARISRI